MRVLVVCEFSQVVTKAFRERGHEAYSCDILPTEGNVEWHIQADIRELLRSRFIRSINLLIAHDPCTYQCNSGVRWLHEVLGRWEKLRESCELTVEILNAPVEKICRENPIPHKYAVALIGQGYTQCVQPHWFVGGDESKATCFWLKGLPILNRTQWLSKAQIRQSVFLMPPGVARWKERSRFPVSIAKAMADQWG